MDNTNIVGVDFPDEELNAAWQRYTRRLTFERDDARGAFDAGFVVGRFGKASTPPADDVREALGLAIEEAINLGPIYGLSFAGRIADAVLAAPDIEVRPRGNNSPNEAPQPLLNEFYASGLRRAIQIIQGEDYPLSHGLARVSSMVSDIEDEISAQEDVQLSEADVVVRWLTTFAERGIVTIGGKGGALEAAREGRP